MVNTPWEDTGELTTIAQEGTFLDALVSSTDRVTYTTLGMSTNGAYPVRKVVIDTPDTPVDAPNILFVGLQHGNEPAGREALLITIRDLAETADTDLVGLLDACRIHVIPSANPAGLPNSRGVPGTILNMNREHLSLAVVESIYVQQAITDLRPVFVLDAHEHFSPSDPAQTQYLPAGAENADPTLVAYSQDIVGLLRAKLTAESVDHDYYASNTYPDPAILRANVSMRGSMFLLMETPGGTDGEGDPYVPMTDRVTYHRWSQQIILDWFVDNLEDAVLAHGLAAEEATHDGATHAPFMFGGASLDPTPAAYTMASPGPVHLDVYGLVHTDDGTTVRVPMGQPDRNIIPHLFDDELGNAVVTATRESAPAPLAPVGRAASMRVRLGGITYVVTKAYLRDGEDTKQILVS